MIKTEIMKKKWLNYTLLGLICLVACSFILSIWLPMNQAFRVIFGSFYLLFLPGFMWSWVFWEPKELDVIERGALSLGLSIAIVPLAVFLLNKAGIRINLFNSIFEILALVCGAIITMLLKGKFPRKLNVK
jgi:uncharacterized membrane protein